MSVTHGSRRGNLAVLPKAPEIKLKTSKGYFRLCRVEPVDIGTPTESFVFTLPINSNRFLTVKEAQESLKQQAQFFSLTGRLAVQQVFEDGTFDRTPQHEGA